LEKVVTGATKAALAILIAKRDGGGYIVQGAGEPGCKVAVHGQDCENEAEPTFKSADTLVSPDGDWSLFVSFPNSWIGKICGRDFTAVKTCGGVQAGSEVFRFAR